jgi:dihydroneopterin aldolase
MDVIRLQNMSFYGYHGLSAAERQTGRRYEVDVELYRDVTNAAKTDRLQNTIDYRMVYDLVEKVLTGEEHHLLESIAEAIADRLLDDFEINQAVVRVRKRMPPIPGNLDFIEIEVKRPCQ